MYDDDYLLPDEPTYDEIREHEREQEKDRQDAKRKRKSKKVRIDLTGGSSSSSSEIIDLTGASSSMSSVKPKRNKKATAVHPTLGYTKDSPKYPQYFDDDANVLSYIDFDQKARNKYSDVAYDTLRESSEKLYGFLPKRSERVPETPKRKKQSAERKKPRLPDEMNEFQWDDDPKVHVDPLKVAGLQPKPNIVQRQEQPILQTQIPVLPSLHQGKGYFPRSERKTPPRRYQDDMDNQVKWPYDLQYDVDDFKEGRQGLSKAELDEMADKNDFYLPDDDYRWDDYEEEYTEYDPSNIRRAQWEKMEDESDDDDDD